MVEGFERYINRDTPFGPIAMDEIHDKDVLSRIYDAETLIHEQMVARKPSYIVGRRGAGKTAVMRSTLLMQEVMPLELGSSELFGDAVRCLERLEVLGIKVFADQMSDVWEAATWAPARHKQ